MLCRDKMMEDAVGSGVSVSSIAIESIRSRQAQISTTAAACGSMKGSRTECKEGSEARYNVELGGDNSTLALDQLEGAGDAANLMVNDCVEAGNDKSDCLESALGVMRSMSPGNGSDLDDNILLRSVDDAMLMDVAAANLGANNDEVTDDRLTQDASEEIIGKVIAGGNFSAEIARQGYLASGGNASNFESAAALSTSKFGA